MPYVLTPRVATPLSGFLADRFGITRVKRVYPHPKLKGGT
jgi:hypothetical protein